MVGVGGERASEWWSGGGGRGSIFHMKVHAWGLLQHPPNFTFMKRRYGLYGFWGMLKGSLDGAEVLVDIFAMF